MNNDPSLEGLNINEESIENAQWHRCILEDTDGPGQLDIVHNIEDRAIFEKIVDQWCTDLPEDKFTSLDLCIFINYLRVQGLGDFYALTWEQYSEAMEELKEDNCPDCDNSQADGTAGDN